VSVSFSSAGDGGSVIVDGSSFMQSWQVQDTGGTSQFDVTDGEVVKFVGSNGITVNFGNDATRFVEIRGSTASDARLKGNVTKLKNILGETLKLNPVSFKWNKEALKENPTYNKGRKIGFIAQEVKEIFPEFVEVWGNPKGKKDPYLCVDYPSMTAVLTQSIKELNKKIDSQEKRIKKLEKLIAPKINKL